MDILSKGFSLPKNKFIEKKNFLHTEYNDTKNFSSEKNLKNISSNTILNRENSAFIHLKNGMKIDFDHHTILEELFPVVYENLKVQKLLINYRKALE